MMFSIVRQGLLLSSVVSALAEARVAWGGTVVLVGGESTTDARRRGRRESSPNRTRPVIEREGFQPVSWVECSGGSVKLSSMPWDEDGLASVRDSSGKESGTVPSISLMTLCVSPVVLATVLIGRFVGVPNESGVT